MEKRLSRTEPEPPEKAASEGVRAVGRALDILQVFTAQDRELSAAEILKRVDLTRPTLYRLLYTLEESGFIVSDGEPQRFRLGTAVARLAHAWGASFDIATIAQPVLRDLWRETGETVSLIVPQGLQRICVAELPSLHALTFRRGIGATERLVRGATGRAVLAFRNLAPGELEQLAQGATDDLEALRAELDATCKRGYAISRNELLEGAIAVAAPLFDRSKDVVGSLGVMGPAVRMSKQVAKLGNQVRDEAWKISSLLGFEGEPPKS